MDYDIIQKFFAFFILLIIWSGGLERFGPVARRPTEKHTLVCGTLNLEYGRNFGNNLSIDFPGRNGRAEKSRGEQKIKILFTVEVAQW